MEPHSKHANARRILIVDDMPISLAPLSLCLEKDGHQVFFCEKAKEIALSIEKLKPDLIIMDIVMPDICGLELCRRLKNDDRTKHIPVIFISAKEDKNTRNLALKTGGADYMVKPIHPACAKEKVKILLQQAPQVNG